MKQVSITSLAVLGSVVTTLVGPARAEVTVERSERGAVVNIDGQLFTEYLTKAGRAPAMWPVIGPTGKPMTRSFPVGPAVDGESDDHPHHQSLWFAHDKVNGGDFWYYNSVAANEDPIAHIDHRDFIEIESAGPTARIVTRNDWMRGNDRVCSDERTVQFGARPNGDRWIDFAIRLKASDGDLTFGDTKEGTFAIRVADSMRLDRAPGGRVINSEGQVDGKAWGKPARWVDYTGPVDGEIVGITFMSHPANFRPAPRWHVRDYGLFAVNPFGESDFPQLPDAEQGEVTIEAGDELALRYRILLHRGALDKAAIEAVFDKFAAE